MVRLAEPRSRSVEPSSREAGEARSAGTGAVRSPLLGEDTGAGAALDERRLARRHSGSGSLAETGEARSGMWRAEAWAPAGMGENE
jgi:hypothetical protein